MNTGPNANAADAYYASLDAARESAQDAVRPANWDDPADNPDGGFLYCTRCEEMVCPDVSEFGWTYCPLCGRAV